MTWLASIRIGKQTYLNLFDFHNPFSIRRSSNGYVLGVFPFKLISHKSLIKK